MKKGGKLLIGLLLILALLATGCSGSKQVQESKETQADSVKKSSMRVATLKGPTGMGMVELMHNNEQGIAALDYQIQIVGSPDDLVGKIISKEVDVAAVPTNLALTLYNRTEGAVQLAAVNTLGVLYLLEQGETIQTLEDLRGKTVNVSGKGASPDFVFRYLLEANGLSVGKDVTLDFALQHSDLAAAAVAGKVDLILLPQPHVTTALMRNENLRIALDISEEWRRIKGEQSELAMGALIVQREFAEKNPQALKDFLAEYQQSVNFVNTNPEQAAELIAKYDLLPNTAIALKAIPYSNIVYIPAQEAKSFLEEFYQILYEFEPRSVGGKLADERFYLQP